MASDEHIAIHQFTGSRVLGEVTNAIVERLSQWLRFSQADSERAAVKWDVHCCRAQRCDRYVRTLDEHCYFVNIVTLL